MNFNVEMIALLLILMVDWTNRVNGGCPPGYDRLDSTFVVGALGSF
jgi:hypothetical protein